MNIIHLLEKIPFLELEFDLLAMPYMILLYLIDVVCTFILAKKYDKPLWPSFIPFYNWRVIFDLCWDRKAFYEHVLLEVLGLAIPVVYEAIHAPDLILMIFVIIDLYVAYRIVRHAIETGEHILKSFGYENKALLVTIFFFDAILILAVKGNYQGSITEE